LNPHNPRGSADFKSATHPYKYMIMNKLFEDRLRSVYADVKVFSFLTGCTSSLLRYQDMVIWSYRQTPRIHAGKLCKVGKAIEQI
jgi:hypothetical protein